MKPHCHFLTAAIVALTCASFAVAETKTDYSRRALGYGQVPDYEVAYQVPEVSEIKADLDRIFSYTQNTTTLKVFDNETGE